jgi:ubiquitin carboxyl-terminal hydrolase 48
MADGSRERFLKASNLGDNPILDAREPDLPVGLKVWRAGFVQHILTGRCEQNLGATCYANAFLQVSVLFPSIFETLTQFNQVWFRDLAFRDGVYRCQPSQDMENQFEVGISSFASSPYPWVFI